MQKQAVINVMEWQFQQVNPDLGTEHCNYNSKITLLPSLNVMDY